jgi:hypothetical protein
MTGLFFTIHEMQPFCIILTTMRNGNRKEEIPVSNFKHNAGSQEVGILLQPQGIWGKYGCCKQLPAERKEAFTDDNGREAAIISSIFKQGVESLLQESQFPHA